jgi:hypothetical protein
MSRFLLYEYGYHQVVRCVLFVVDFDVESELLRVED